MSIKKLGGIRLRLAVGMTAALAVCGVIFAFGGPKKLDPPDIQFAGNVLGGLAPAKLEVRGYSANTTYYLVPINLESPTPLDDLTGWDYDTSQSGAGTSGDPYLFDEGSTDFIAFTTDEHGDKDVYIATVNPENLSDQSTSVEMRSVSATGSAVDSDTITILEW